MLFLLVVALSWSNTSALFPQLSLTDDTADETENHLRLVVPLTAALAVPWSCSSIVGFDLIDKDGNMLLLQQEVSASFYFVPLFVSTVACCWKQWRLFNYIA